MAAWSRGAATLPILVGLIVGLGYACAKTQVAKDSSPALSPNEDKALDEYRAEIEIGRNMAGRLLAYYGAIENDALVGYVNQVGSYVGSYSDHPERRYMFAILKHESVNAFACPGGYILVTMGALRAAQNEAELAAILGHETAHVGKQHMFQTLKRMKKAELEDMAKQRASREKEDPLMQKRERPQSEETGAGAMLARYLSGSAGAAINVLQAAQAGMTLITEKGLDHELEREADAEGVKYAIRAGYEPKALLQYLERVAKGSKKIKNLEKTHPPIGERKKNIVSLLASLNANEILGAKGEERFLKMRKGFPRPDDD